MCIIHHIKASFRTVTVDIYQSTRAVKSTSLIRFRTVTVDIYQMTKSNPLFNRA